MSRLIERFNHNSLFATLGIEFISLAEGKASAKLEPPPAVCWPFEGQPHGGVLFTLMDTTMAIGVISLMGETCSSATISLDIQYTARARSAPFICRSSVTHSTKNLCFSRAQIEDADGQVVALGQGTFKVIRSAREDEQAPSKDC